jgi:hypothetical protein
LAALLRAGVVLVVSCEIGRVSWFLCSLIRDGGLLAPGRGKKRGFMGRAGRAARRRFRSW